MQENMNILAIMEKVRAKTMATNKGGYVGDLGDVFPPIYNENKFLTRGGKRVPNLPNVPTRKAELAQKSTPSSNTPPLLVLDFETYYDEAYSLTKMSVPEYVLDPRFKVLGLAIRRPDGREVFNTDAKMAIEGLQRAYGENLERTLVVMHNAAFDLFILRHKFGLMPLRFIDTMLLSRLLLGAKHPASLKELAEHFGLESKGRLEFMSGVDSPDEKQLKMLDEYARTDVRITSNLAEIFLSDPALPGAELEIMAHTVRNFVDTPLEVDGAVVDHALCEFNGILEETTAKTGHSVEEYSGRKSFAEILGKTLEKHGGSLPVKSDKNGNPIPAVAKDDEEMQELLNNPVEEIRDIARVKMLVASAPNIRSKLEFLKSSATLPGAKLYPELAYHRAQTGRFAGAGGFNIQNLGHAERSEHIPPEIVGAIAKAIRVPAGRVLVASDASQIEARILAFLSGEKELHNSFAKGNDVYSDFASATFGEKVEKTKGDTPEALRMKALRQVGKMAVLGLGYGMGAATFEKNLRSEPSVSSLFETGLLSADKCAGLVRDYRLKYPLVAAFWRNSEKAFRMAVDGVGSSVSGVGFLKQDGNVVLRLPSGRSLIYEDARVEPSEKGVVIVYGDDKKLYGGKIVENIVQAVARDILCRAILEIEKKGFSVITHIHDSIICAAENEDAEACLKTMEDSWRSIPEWIAGLCLDAESKKGPSLADVI